MCDTVTVLLGDIVLLAFEKILDLFFWAQKTTFLQLHKFPSEARAYNGGLEAYRPQRGPGAEPLVKGLRGEAPLKLKAFELSNIQWKRLNALFSLLQ